MQPGAYHDPEVSKSNLMLLTEFEVSGHASYWMDIYKSLDERKQNSFLGKWLHEVAILSVGQPFPHFTLSTPEGKNLSLKEVVGNGKATVVHFWSANSNDKSNQDELRAMYKKYHDKGLNVVGLFHDDSYGQRDAYTKTDLTQQWKDLLKKEEFPWYNVADLRGAESIVDKVYREGGNNNTTNVILDAEGKIVAWNARGAALQYYLWKIFQN